MTQSLRRVERLTNLIGASLCRTDCSLSYGRTLEAIRLLCAALHTVETDEGTWELGEHLFPLSDLIVGAYWFCSDYHSGQRSIEYQTLSALSEIYTPGCCESGPETDSSSSDAYNALAEKYNNR